MKQIATKLSLVFALFSLNIINNCAWALGGGSEQPGVASNIVMLLAFVLIFYFLLIRPQTKKAKEHQNLISKIAKDDEVVTTGGIVGKVEKVTDQFLVVKISESTNVIVQKQAIATSLPKGTIKNI